jgi:ankyrin repeat protein
MRAVHINYLQGFHRMEKGQVLEPSEALRKAALRGDVAACRRALAAGADVDARDPNGLSPLMLAARYGQSGAVELLAGPDACMAKTPGGLDALMCAAQAGRGECVEMLAPQSDARRKAADGSTALMCASSSDSHRAVMALMPLSDLEAVDNDGCTALMRAAAAGSSKTALMLAQRCDALRVADSGHFKGMTASLLAARSGREELARQLAAIEHALRERRDIGEAVGEKKDSSGAKAHRI